MNKAIKMKQKKQNSMIVGVFALTAMVVVTAMAIYGLSSTVGEIRELAVAETPEAVLASAGVENAGDVMVPVAYFDQRADECVNMYDDALRAILLARQFEWTRCGYGGQWAEEGLVDYYLGNDSLPVGVGGRLTVNRSLNDLTRWFKEVDNKSKRYAKTLPLRYVAQELKFFYEGSEFYPLDDVEFSNDDYVNGDGHNHLFTMSLAVPFRVAGNGSEALEIEADDDTFVFVNERLAIDLGGVHEPMKGVFRINEQGEVMAGKQGEELAFTGIKLELGDNAIIRIFHADRDAESSVFNMSLIGIESKIVNTQIADSDGVQVAYDPNDPLYAKPLGVSKTVQLDNKRSYIIIATIYGVTIIVVAMGVVVLARYLMRVRR